MNILEFFENDFFADSLQVYRLKPERNLSLASLGNLNWENLACLAIIYLICYFSMWKGVKTSGKVSDRIDGNISIWNLGCLVYCFVSICCTNDTNGPWSVFEWFNERY